MSVTDTIVREALENYRAIWVAWLRSKNTTDSERELAHMKIQLIDHASEDISKRGLVEADVCQGSEPPNKPACEFCGDPATKVEFYEEETPVCERCSCQ